MGLNGIRCAVRGARRQDLALPAQSPRLAPLAGLRWCGLGLGRGWGGRRCPLLSWCIELPPPRRHVALLLPKRVQRINQERPEHVALVCRYVVELRLHGSRYLRQPCEACPGMPGLGRWCTLASPCKGSRAHDACGRQLARGRTRLHLAPPDAQQLAQLLLHNVCRCAEVLPRVRDERPHHLHVVERHFRPRGPRRPLLVDRRGQVVDAHPLGGLDGAAQLLPAAQVQQGRQRCLAAERILGSPSAGRTSAPEPTRGEPRRGSWGGTAPRRLRSDSTFPS